MGNAQIPLIIPLYAFLSAFMQGENNPMSQETTKVQQHLVQSSHFSTATSPEVTASQHLRKRKSSAQPLLLSVSDVATLLGVCRQTVYNYMYHEGLPSISV